MNGNKREFYCLEENLKILHEYSLIRGSCHTPSDGSQKYPDLCTKKVSVRNEDSVLIGMQDLTANKLFGHLFSIFLTWFSF